MKANFIKYVFIIFVIGIIVFAIYTIYFKEKEKEQEQENVVQGEDKVEIKDLRLGISNYDTINPLISNNKEVLNIGQLIYEPLIKIDENYKAQLCLAKECSKTSEVSYIVKVNKNVKWYDGTYLGARDVQFTIDRLKELNSIYAHNVEKVISVELLDDETVKINLSEEVPFFEYNLVFPILSYNNYVGEDFKTSAKVPIGTGMFTINTIENGIITLIKNENWWNIEEQNSKIESIKIKLYSEVGEVYNSFKLGNIDILTTANINLEQYIGTIGYAKREIKGRNFDYLAFNCNQDLLKNIVVRKVINYCIDKTNIVTNTYNNNYYISNFPLDYGNYLYNEERVSLGYDQEQAKKILEEDGWEYKNNRWQKRENGSTKRLDFKLTVCSAHDKRVLVAENIKAQLEQIGIKVTINKVSESQYQKILKNKNYEMIITGVTNSYSPDLTTFLGNDNLQNYINPEIINILNEVKSISDINLLKEKYNRILEIYNEEVPFVSLYRNKQTVVKSQNLAGELKSNNYFSYYGLFSWYRM